MGCICDSYICTLTCYTNPQSSYNCGYEDFMCQPDPCCDYACEYSTIGDPQTYDESATQNCTFRNPNGNGTWVTGGIKVTTYLTQSIDCHPISPPPEGCATTSPPPPGNDCGGAGG